MFKLPSNKPNLNSKYEDWADYSEYLALKKGLISFNDILKPSLAASDELEIDGTEDDTDKLGYKSDEISSEINRRISATNGKYPFVLSNRDYNLSVNITDENHYHIYIFLLLATRLKMSEQRIQAGIDGTHLFEKISAIVAKNFFGENTEGDVFGTSKTDVKGFRAKLREVISQMKEGGTVHERIGLSPQDDKVDIIVWKGFKDKKTSKLIAFGQCKTGTSWKSKLSELNTMTFCNTWFTMQPILLPIKMFFCAQYFHTEIWEGKGYEAGLIFDRFRIMDYLPPTIEDELLSKIKQWTEAAQALYNID